VFTATAVIRIPQKIHPLRAEAHNRALCFRRCLKDRPLPSCGSSPTITCRKRLPNPARSHLA